jgi:hypothetical protein
MPATSLVKPAYGNSRNKRYLCTWELRQIKRSDDLEPGGDGIRGTPPHPRKRRSTRGFLFWRNCSKEGVRLLSRRRNSDIGPDRLSSLISMALDYPKPNEPFMFSVRYT